MTPFLASENFSVFSWIPFVEPWLDQYLSAVGFPSESFWTSSTITEWPFPLWRQSWQKSPSLASASLISFPSLNLVTAATTVFLSFSVGPNHSWRRSFTPLASRSRILNGFFASLQYFS